jgi:hypothetical protein
MKTMSNNSELCVDSSVEAKRESDCKALCLDSAVGWHCCQIIIIAPTANTVAATIMPRFQSLLIPLNQDYQNQKMRQEVLRQLCQAKAEMNVSDLPRK